jgi:transcriptional regulator with XRE-family HTH domain
MRATTIGSALVQRRLELSLEKGQAAKQIGMSRTTYSSYEQDAQRPSTEVFSALAEFLGMSVEQFLPLYGATCVAQARVSLGRVVPQSQQSGEASSELSPSVDQRESTSEVASGMSSSREPESTTIETAPQPAAAAPEESIETEVALEVAEVEDTPEPSATYEPVEMPEPRTDTSRASQNDLSLSWPSSTTKGATHNKKKKKKKKEKKG